MFYIHVKRCKFNLLSSIKIEFFKIWQKITTETLLNISLVFNEIHWENRKVDILLACWYFICSLLTRQGMTTRVIRTNITVHLRCKVAQASIDFFKNHIAVPILYLLVHSCILASIYIYINRVISPLHVLLKKTDCDS